MMMVADKSLLRCTLRKSSDVFAKLVLYASYVVCGVTALWLVGYLVLAVASVVSDPIRVAINSVCGVIAFAGSLAAMVPWYAYVGIAAVAAIFGYSYLWCVARELTEEDYQSEIAKRIAELLVLVLGLWLVLGLLGLVLGLWLVLGLLGLLWLVLGLVLDETKVFLFIGAYLHYRKRMGRMKYIKTILVEQERTRR